MKTADALTNIDKEIAAIVAEWHLDSDNDGKTHLLETKTEADKLYALDKSLKHAASVTAPSSLTEDSATGTDPIWTKLNQCQYIRVPATPVNAVDENLDIDEALAFGVIFYSIGILDSTQDKYLQKGERWFKDFNTRYKQYMMTLPNGSPC